jgi:hypothetical protein
VIFGKQETFAIEAEISNRSEGWVLGHFRFWVHSKPIGNWDDTADLRGCAGWIRDFLDEKIDRREPSLDKKSAEEIMKELFDDVMPARSSQPSSGDRSRRIDALESAEVLRRFHISHLGMSAFDHVDLLLMESPEHRQRFVWRDVSDLHVHDAILDPDDIRSAAEAFCAWFQQEGPRT